MMPHLAEEMWHELGHAELIADTAVAQGRSRSRARRAGDDRGAGQRQAARHDRPAARRRGSGEVEEAALALPAVSRAARGQAAAQGRRRAEPHRQRRRVTRTAVTARRLPIARAAARRLHALLAGLGALGGCGWTPLYADMRNRRRPMPNCARSASRRSPSGSASASPSRCARRSNPSGIETQQRYRAAHHAAGGARRSRRADPGPRHPRPRRCLRHLLPDRHREPTRSSTAGTSHVAELFDILANQYSNVVAEEDARNRTVEELRRDLVSRLTIFLQNRRAA